MQHVPHSPVLCGIALRIFLTPQIVKNNPWPKPIAVYGYDSTFAIAGDLFEAETGCFSGVGAGQIASDGVNNLAFYGTGLKNSPDTTPLPSNPEVPAHYNASLT